MLAGAHRIQRVPAGEKRGRRHSSEVRVVWFDDSTPPAAARLDRSVVRVDTFRASGAGGQHRNKTDSGVRLTHLPSGLVVTATEERSQHQNREVAWRRLDAALAEQQLAAAQAAVNGQRREALEEFRTWTWCGWRDEVRTPSGCRASMRRALAGRLGPLLE